MITKTSNLIKYDPSLYPEKSNNLYVKGNSNDQQLLHKLLSKNPELEKELLVVYNDHDLNHTEKGELFVSFLKNFPTDEDKHDTERLTKQAELTTDVIQVLAQRNQASRQIVGLFRRSHENQAHGHMFSAGTRWNRDNGAHAMKQIEKDRKTLWNSGKPLREDFNKAPTEKVKIIKPTLTEVEIAQNVTNSQEGTRKLHEISKNNLECLQDDVREDMSSDEFKLYCNFMNADIYATHFSDNELLIEPTATSKVFSLHSRVKLVADGKIKFDPANTTERDVIELANDDNIFFSLDIGKEGAKNISRFGDTRFRVPFENDKIQQHGWLTMYDQLEPGLAFADSARLQKTYNLEGDDLKKIKTLHATLDHNVKNSGTKHKAYEGIFSAKDMKEGMALSLIRAIRGLSSDGRMKLLSDLSPEGLNKLLNHLYRPELKVPHMFSTKEFEMTEPKDKIRPRNDPKRRETVTVIDTLSPKAIRAENNPMADFLQDRELFLRDAFRSPEDFLKLLSEQPEIFELGLKSLNVYTVAKKEQEARKLDNVAKKKQHDEPTKAGKITESWMADKIEEFTTQMFNPDKIAPLDILTKMSKKQFDILLDLLTNKDISLSEDQINEAKRGFRSANHSVFNSLSPEALGILNAKIEEINLISNHKATNYAKTIQELPSRQREILNTMSENNNYHEVMAEMNQASQSYLK